MYKITSFKFIDNNKNNTILFLHGWMCSIKYMLPLSYISNANCVFIDLPGMGNNKPLLHPFNYMDYIDTIIYFLKENNLKITHIVGHSFGGKLAVKLANILNIKSLILIAPSTFNKKRGLLYYIKVYTYKFIKRFKCFKKYLKRFGSEDYKSLNNVMKKTMSNVINYSIKEDLKKISIPVIIIRGSNDNITPLYIFKKSKKLLKDCEIITIDGDHFAYIKNDFQVIKIIESMVN